MATTKSFPDRVRFNWGFWDARLDRDSFGSNRLTGERGKLQRDPYPLPEDPAYVAGYGAGQKSAPDVSTSDHAHKEWMAGKVRETGNRLLDTFAETYEKLGTA